MLPAGAGFVAGRWAGCVVGRCAGCVAGRCAGCVVGFCAGFVVGAVGLDGGISLLPVGFQSLLLLSRWLIFPSLSRLYTLPSLSAKTLLSFCTGLAVGLLPAPTPGLLLLAPPGLAVLFLVRSLIAASRIFVFVVTPCLFLYRLLRLLLFILMVFPVLILILLLP
jgi:hypothetical protein